MARELEKLTVEMIEQAFMDVRSELANRVRLLDYKFYGRITLELTFEDSKFKSADVSSSFKKLRPKPKK